MKKGTRKPKVVAPKCEALGIDPDPLVERLVGIARDSVNAEAQTLATAAVQEATSRLVPEVAAEISALAGIKEAS